MAADEACAAYDHYSFKKRHVEQSAPPKHPLAADARDTIQSSALNLLPARSAAASPTAGAPLSRPDIGVGFRAGLLHGRPAPDLRGPSFAKSPASVRAP